MKKARAQSKANHSSAASNATRENSGNAVQARDAVNSAQLKAVSLTLNASPSAIAQKKQKDSIQQSQSTVESIQRKFLGDSAVSQRAAEEEEMLQGKFETSQLVEEEEALQGKFDEPAQLVEDEEMLQGKFETAQRVEDEEMLQGKFETAQLVEDEELMQGKFQVAQAKKSENNTGLPDNLKAGIENMSGVSMDSVQVHYNSDRPAQLNAHAYAQGTDIHVASGQEKHLPHEAWHVVQQAQGRVQPTTQMAGGTQVNDDSSLEKEADDMGAKAAQFKADSQSSKSAK